MCACLFRKPVGAALTSSVCVSYYYYYFRCCCFFFSPTVNLDKHVLPSRKADTFTGLNNYSLLSDAVNPFLNCFSTNSIVLNSLYSFFLWCVRG